MTVHTEVAGQASVTNALNLSVTGMLVESTVPLTLYQEMSFRFKLPDGSHVVGSGRPIREAAPHQYGVEFVHLEHESKDAIFDYVRSAAVR
jgi:predicted Zn-dependent protease